MTQTLFSDPVVALSLGKRLSRPAAPQGLLPRFFGRRPRSMRPTMALGRKAAE